MCQKIYSFCSKAVKVCILTCLIGFAFSSPANAQKYSNAGLTYGGGSGGGDNNWGIALAAGYEMPLGDVGTIFKGAPSFSISVLRNYGDFTFNASVEFATFKPKLDTFSYYTNGQPDGYIKYDNLGTIEIYSGVAYNIHFGQGSNFYFGLNAGSYIQHFGYAGSDILTAGALDTYDEESYIAPKIGVNFALSDKFSLGLEGKYNFFISSNSGSGDTYDFGYSSTVTKSYSGNVVLTYNF